ncbi:MAG TPA: di-heme oxidoredictase family protein, partial [Bryobacteraceae bacterium]|nr:di-heme oxidoredictase family protein [Bryobacteraceae bacterium]
MVKSRYSTLLLTAGLMAGQIAQAQTDPGPRNGPPNAGRPLPGLNANEFALFNEGARRFREMTSVSGAQPGAPGSGLGPRFNLNGCAGCHAQPTAGGTSPQVNPQIAAATAFGAQNTVPAFIQQNGPVRVVRFQRNPDGSPDGGVHDLFVITGRSDAGNCRIAQPDFAAAVAQNNASFRIPTPVYGAGLIEAIPDSTILANLAANGQQKAALGIRGRVNRSASDGTITRFGWKAQNKSLLMFAGEAYNVEQGVTNDLFPTERDETPGCVFNLTPEDRPKPANTNTLAGMSDLAAFTTFMRFLAPADPAPPGDPSAQRGSQIFAQIGCALCHTP